MPHTDMAIVGATTDSFRRFAWFSARFQGRAPATAVTRLFA
jgi:hypothetical protein